MTDVLVCGAGAAGLTLAVDLARRGVNFRLIDKSSNPFAGSRGKAIQPRTLEVFEDLDIVDRIAACGGEYPPQREYRSDGSHKDSQEFAVSDPTPREPYRVTKMIPQFLTESVLRNRLAELGHRAEFGCELTAFQQNGTGVTATVVSAKGEETVQTRYLVGADGGRSFVRQTLQIEFFGQTLGVRAIVADVLLTGISRDFWHRFNRGEMLGQISLCPLQGTEMFQLQGPVPLEGRIDLSADGLSMLVAQRTGRSDIAIHSVSWASAYQMNARLAEKYRKGSVFLAGDAAHTHPPTGGQGLNTSVQDAYNLGWKLAAVLRGAPDTLLSSYEQERRPIAAQMLGLATKLLETTRAGSMRRGREVQQLDIAYRDSCLSLERIDHPLEVKAGDRAPDAPIRGAGGQPTRLFNLMKGPHWTLIGYEIQRPFDVKPRSGLRIHTVGQRGNIVDEGGHVRGAYGVQPGEWVLVRPDGYIGAIVSSDHVSELTAYFSQVGLDGVPFPLDCQN